MDEKIQGWVNLYKPKGISSFSAIYKIKKKFNIKKIGHAGTLDPAAEGIAIAAEQVKSYLGMAQGVHLMAVKAEERIPAILDQAEVSLQEA